MICPHCKKNTTVKEGCKHDWKYLKTIEDLSYPFKYKCLICDKVLYFKYPENKDIEKINKQLKKKGLVFNGLYIVKKGVE